MSINYQAIFKNGGCYEAESFSQIEKCDCLFFAKKTEVFHCNTYSRYVYEFIDSSSEPLIPEYKGHKLLGLKITGEASDLQLVLDYQKTNGEKQEHTFHKDISFNNPSSYIIRIKPEWNVGEEFKVVFAFLDSIDRIGEEATLHIIELEREIFRVKAESEAKITRLNQVIESEKEFTSYVEEIIVPDGCKRLYDGVIDKHESLKRVFLPQSLESIPCLPFLQCDKIESVTCAAPIPPRIYYSYSSYDPSVPLYVPRAAVDAYKSHEMWGKIFAVIKGV